MSMITTSILYRRPLAAFVLLSGRRNLSATGPDKPTSINIHEHKLTRPERIPKPKGSLIPETLKEMLNDEDFIAAQKALKAKGQKALTKEERKMRQRALDALGVPPFDQKVNPNEMRRKPTEVLQLNVGLYCNQACSHCHVESSPKRLEMMSRSVADRCLHVLGNSSSVITVDLTGGAPELCSEFRHLVEGSRKLGKRVIDRCNLTALLEPGQEDTAQFLADNQVDVIASLPCYSAKNVNLQRGSGVFQRSISALHMLNDLGYGQENSPLRLDLVYNPLGAFLPPDQAELEDKYKQELLEVFGIKFNHLYTMTNMPIKRFADFLNRRGEMKMYMDLLVRHMNAANIDGLMCRNLLSVNYDGAIFDCDFNQQLSLTTEGQERTIFQVESCDDFASIPIRTDNHCYGCMAGQGSS